MLLHNGADMQMQYVDEVEQDADDEEYELNTSPSLENEHPGGESTDDSTVAVFCGSPIEVAASSQSAWSCIKFRPLTAGSRQWPMSTLLNP